MTAWELLSHLQNQHAMTLYKAILDKKALAAAKPATSAVAKNDAKGKAEREKNKTSSPRRDERKEDQKKDDVRPPSLPPLAPLLFSSFTLYSKSSKRLASR